MEPKNWICPYCGHAQIVNNETYADNHFSIDNDLSKYGKIGGKVISTVCSNKECKEITLDFSLNEVGIDYANKWRLTDHAYHSWSLLPESSAKPQPDYIPDPIVESYKQACRIRDLSPNVSMAEQKGTTSAV